MDEKGRATGDNAARSPDLIANMPRNCATAGKRGQVETANAADRIEIAIQFAFEILIEVASKQGESIARMVGKWLKPTLVSFAVVYAPTFALLIFDRRSRPGRMSDWFLSLLLGPGFGPSYVLVQLGDWRMGLMKTIAEDFYLVVPIAILATIVAGLTLMGGHGPRWLIAAAVFGLGMGCFSAWTLYHLARME